jgi:hypothetical protein
MVVDALDTPSTPGTPNTPNEPKHPVGWARFHNALDKPGVLRLAGVLLILAGVLAAGACLLSVYKASFTSSELGLGIASIASLIAGSLLYILRSQASEEAWNDIGGEVTRRYALLKEAHKALETYKFAPAAQVRVAATDVFVEKAQYRLSKRAKLLLLGGAVTGLAAIVILVFAAFAVYRMTPLSLTGGEKLDGNLLTIIVLRAVSFGGFLTGAVFFLVSLSKAFFHEATVLYGRRHALRFGRLVVYLEDGAPSRESIERAFRWNDDFASAFKDIQPDAMRELGVAKLANMPPDLVKALADVHK